MPKKRITRHMVMARTPTVMKKGLETGKGTLSFKDRPAMVLTDESLVGEIRKRHGRDILIHEDERLESYVRDDRSGGLHHYFFGSTRRYRENFDRIFRR